MELDVVVREIERGSDGIKEFTVPYNGIDVKICVASGLANARKVLEAVKSGEKEYHFIEIMACPGGCINGGGQPLQRDSVRNYVDLKTLRSNVLYNEDAANELRCSHESPVCQMLYDEFLVKPGKGKAHSLLHTTYTPR